VGTAGIYARVDATGANDYSIYWDTGTAKWVLGKDVASAGTILASSSTPLATASSTHTALLRVHGTSVAAWVDNVQIGSVTDSSIAAANKAGIFLNGSATPSDSIDVHFDNYLVSDTPMPPLPAVWHNPLSRNRRHPWPENTWRDGGQRLDLHDHQPVHAGGRARRHAAATARFRADAGGEHHLGVGGRHPGPPLDDERHRPRHDDHPRQDRRRRPGGDSRPPSPASRPRRAP
jgi:hypothetical protein